MDVLLRLIGRNHRHLRIHFIVVTRDIPTLFQLQPLHFLALIFTVDFCAKSLTQNSASIEPYVYLYLIKNIPIKRYGQLASFFVLTLNGRVDSVTYPRGATGAMAPP